VQPDGTVVVAFQNSQNTALYESAEEFDNQYLVFADNRAGRHDVANPVSGEVGVLYHDRGYGNPALYNTTLAAGKPGAFVYTKVSTQPSHPKNSIFFQAEVEGRQKCVTFIGDYIGLDYGRDGKANMAWTDMRQFGTVDDVSGYTQHIVYARR
jgi:hypothetical protein